jgi:hypothetical protein
MVIPFASAPSVKQNPRVVEDQVTGRETSITIPADGRCQKHTSMCARVTITDCCWWRAS